MKSRIKELYPIFPALAIIGAFFPFWYSSNDGWHLKFELPISFSSGSFGIISDFLFILIPVFLILIPVVCRKGYTAAAFSAMLLYSAARLVYYLTSYKFEEWSRNIFSLAALSLISAVGMIYLFAGTPGKIVSAAAGSAAITGGVIFALSLILSKSLTPFAFIDTVYVTRTYSVELYLFYFSQMAWYVGVFGFFFLYYM